MKKTDPKFYHTILSSREEAYYRPSIDAIYRRLLDIHEKDEDQDYFSMIHMLYTHDFFKRDKAYLDEVYEHFMACTGGKFRYYDDDHSMCEMVLENYLYVLYAYLQMNDLPGYDMLYLWLEGFNDFVRSGGKKVSVHLSPSKFAENNGSAE